MKSVFASAVPVTSKFTVIASVWSPARVNVYSKLGVPFSSTVSTVAVTEICGVSSSIMVMTCDAFPASTVDGDVGFVRLRFIVSLGSLIASSLIVNTAF